MILVLFTSKLLHVYTPSRTLHSSSDTYMLTIQQYKCKAMSCHTFSCFGPHIWNSLPQDLRHCSTLSSFKAKLKTFLFSQYFCPSWYQDPVSTTVIACACVCVCFHILPYVNCLGRTVHDKLMYIYISCTHQHPEHSPSTLLLRFYWAFCSWGPEGKLHISTNTILLQHFTH